MIHLASDKRSLFGVPLSELFNDEPHHAEFEIPMFLATIILFIDSHGRVPGIFKTKAENGEVEELMRRFEDGDEIELQNPHAVAGLLLLFLVLLPEPVLCDNYSQYIEAARHADVMTLQRLVSHLPPPNYLLLRAILLLLHHMSTDSHIGDIGASDLAQIITPLLLMGPVSSMEQDMEEIITLGELFIEEYAVILAPFEEYAAMIGDDGEQDSSSSTLDVPRHPSSHDSQSSTPSQLAPFQRSKYSVNYEIKLSSLSGQLSPSSQPPSLLSTLPAFPNPPRPSSPTYVPAPPSPSPARSPSPFSLPATSSPKSSLHPTSAASPSSIHSYPATRHYTPLKTDPTMVGIYGIDPELKYTKSNEQLRQLDARFEEMVEDMQEKRVLFLNQIDNIRKRMVVSTPSLYTPPRPVPILSRTSPSPHTSAPTRTSTPPRSASPLTSTSPHTSTHTPTTPRGLTPNASAPSRSPTPNTLPPRSPAPSSPLPSRSSIPRSVSPALRTGTQNLVQLSPEPTRAHSPSHYRVSPSPFLHNISGHSDGSDEPEDIEQLLQHTRIMTEEDRDIESLHNYYYDKMKVLYTEIQGLKSAVRNLQKDAFAAKIEKQELQDLNMQKDEKIRSLESEIGRLKNPEELQANKPSIFRPPLPPERKAPSPPQKKI